MNSVKENVLAITDDVVLPASAVFNAIRQLKSVSDEEIQHYDPQIITCVSTLSNLPVESSSVDIVLFLWKSLESPTEPIVQEILRVLKEGGSVLVFKVSPSAVDPREAATSNMQSRLLLAGFSEVQVIQLNSIVTSECVPFGVKAKKPSWKIGSSFAIKKAVKLPKIQIDNDSDLIDEDSLLTEEDLKKPQLPPVGDCEVGSTRKACKNCTCGRAEAEEKALKIGLTAEQVTNPQSACGSCGLGDAFRCSTCPYRGLPAFKLGEKVSLSSNFLAADI